MKSLEKTSRILNSKITLLAFALGVIVFNFSVNISPIGAKADSSSGITLETLLEIHNEERLNAGLNPLKFNSKLTVSAQTKAKAMLAEDCWSHYCPDGKSPWDFFSDAGYDYEIAGENLAEGFYDLDELMRAWFNSETHKENILKPQFEDVGFGLAYGDFQGKEGNLIVAVHFGSSNDSPSGVIANKEVSLDFPKQDQTFTFPNISIRGRAYLADAVFVYGDGQFLDTIEVDGANFSYTWKEVESGEHTIYAEAVYSDQTRLKSDVISVNVNTEVLSLNDESMVPFISSIAPETKNMINLVFALIFALIFLIDFILLEYTDVFGRKKSFSHFNFSIFIVVAIIIVVGGFGGHLTESSALI